MKYAIVALSLVLATTTYADSSSCPSAQGIVSACRTAMQKRDKQIADSNAALQKQIDATAAANKRVEEDDAKLQSWTHSPVFLTVLGFAAGAVAGVYVSRH